MRLSDIKRETYQWADMGIVNAQDAQQYLARRVGEKPFIEALYRALGAGPGAAGPQGAARLPLCARARLPRRESVELAVRRTEAHQVIVVWIIRSGIPRQWEKERRGLLPSARSRARAGEPHGGGRCRPDRGAADGQRYARGLGAGMARAKGRDQTENEGGGSE
ncbi:MAG: hypothetical protein ACLR4Z_19000 [Butyricicoccaceae bacterium]